MATLEHGGGTNWEGSQQRPGASWMCFFDGPFFVAGWDDFCFGDFLFFRRPSLCHLCLCFSFFLVLGLSGGRFVLFAPCSIISVPFPHPHFPSPFGWPRGFPVPHFGGQPWTSAVIWPATRSCGTSCKHAGIQSKTCGLFTAKWAFFRHLLRNSLQALICRPCVRTSRTVLNGPFWRCYSANSRFGYSHCPWVILPPLPNDC